MFDGNLEYKGCLQAMEEGTEIWSLLEFSKGVLLGGSSASITIYERSTEELKSTYIKSTRTIVVPE
jgi:hypothetical protein